MIPVAADSPRPKIEIEQNGSDLIIDLAQLNYF